MQLRHTFTYFLSHGIPGILTFLSVIIFTRLISPNEYGTYALILVYAGFMRTVIFQWLRLSLLRFYPKQKKNDAFFRTILYSFIGLMIITLLFSVIVGLISNNDIITMKFMLYAVVLAWFLAWLELNLTLVRSQYNPILYGKISFIRSLLTLSLGILFISLGMREFGIVLGTLAGVGISIFNITLKFWMPFLSYEKSDNDKSKIILADITKYGLPLTLTFSLGFILNSSDRLFLTWFIDKSATGIYSVAYDFTEQSILTLMTIVNLAAFPIVLKAFEEKGIDSASKQLKINATLLLIVSIPAVIGVYALNEHITNLFFGVEYRSSVILIMPLISFVAFLKGMKLFYIDVAFQLLKKTKLQLIPVVVAALINLVLNYFMIQAWGIIGAVIATVISYAISIIISVILVRGIIDLKFPLIDFLKILSASILMLIPLIYSSNFTGIISLILKISISIVIYIILIIILNVGNKRGKYVEKVKYYFENK